MHTQPQDISQQDEPQLSCDQFLNGRLTLYQPQQGFRFGTASLLLGAAFPTQGRVAELGCGVGGASLWALAREPQDPQHSLHIIGFERDPLNAQLCERNIAHNRRQEQMSVHLLDIFAHQAEAVMTTYARSFDAVMINPPFYQPNSGRISPQPRRALAHSTAYSIKDWMACAKLLLQAKGRLVMILPSEALESIILAAQTLNFGQITLRPIYTRQGKSAKLCLVALRKNRLGALVVLPALVLRQNDNSHSAHMQQLFLQGQAIAMERT